MSENTMKMTATNCETMDDVRYEIDRLDRDLVALLAERLSYIEAAGRIKAVSYTHLTLPTICSV